MAGELLTWGLSNQSIINSKAITTLINTSISVVIGKPEFTIVLDYYLTYTNIARVRILRKLLGGNAWTTFVDEELNYTDGTNISKTYNGFTDIGMQTAGVFILLLSPKDVIAPMIRCGIIAKSNFIIYHATDQNKLLRICNNPMASADKYRIPIGSSDVSSVTDMITSSVGTLMQNGQCIFGQN